MNEGLISIILPKGLEAHFDFIKMEELNDESTNKICLYFYLDEKNNLPEGYDSSEFESKGFYPIKTIQDFPIRGKAVYLLIRRRRWRNKIDKSYEIKNDYSFIAEGSKITAELSDFLKGTGRDPRRYDK